MMVSPGDSSTPANIDPIMTDEAPAANALTISPEYRSPPSAITGTPMGFKTSETSMMAVSWGTPTPATTRVVQMEPGPMPTFTASAPASAKYLPPSAVATLPTTMSMSPKVDLAFSNT